MFGLQSMLMEDPPYSNGVSNSVKIFPGGSDVGDDNRGSVVGCNG